MQNILITGGNGFIGSHLSEYMRVCGFNIYTPSSKELDVLQQEDWEKWKIKDIKHVVHLAGKTFVPDSWDNPEDFFNVNVKGTLNTIRFCREQNIGMTYISAYIYGQPKSNPISEMAEVVPNNPYARSKYMAEELCSFFCEYYEMNITVLRLFNVYGPAQNEKFLIPFIIRQAIDKTDAIMVQDLAPKRDYIYVGDVCCAIKTSVDKTDGYHLFNIGSGESYSVREIIEKVQNVAGTHKKAVSKNIVRRNELNDVVADINAIEKTWGWKPQTSLEDGLLQCVEAMR